MRVAFLALALVACGSAAAEDWKAEEPNATSHRPAIEAEHVDTSVPVDDATKMATLPGAFSDDAPSSDVAMIGKATTRTDLYRNTYYDFPKESAGAKDATLFDGDCKAIAKVTRAFHDQVCVQGSGRLEGGATVSFAKRGCACADVCPRTGQKICFERLDPARFPSGRGATGKPITPLSTIAVDTTVIPLGTKMYIPDFVGLPRPDGKKHDGCFVAEDKGIKVVGKQIDVFTGDPSVTADWNGRVPSNKGVRVFLNDYRCR